MSRREAGDIVGGWLLRLALVMAILGFIGYEGISTAVTAVTVDGAARDVARAAATGYRGDEDPKAGRAAADAQAIASGVVITDFTIEGDIVIVTVTDTAPTIVIHELDFFEGVTTPSATARAKWRI